MRVSDERLDPSGLSRPDGAVPYTLIWGLAVPRLPGIYVINDIRGPLYVGRSIDLRRRFEEHYDGSHNPLLAGALSRPLGLLTFSWFLVDQESLSTVEHRLIGLLQPICNIIKSRSKPELLQRN